MNESDMLKDETENIKNHNKALFGQITNNQDKHMVGTHPSNDVALNQNSVFSANNDSLHQSTINESQPQNVSMMQNSFNQAQISMAESAAAASNLKESSVGDIHSLY